MTVTVRAEEKKWPDDLEEGRSYLVEVKREDVLVVLHGRFEGFYLFGSRPARFFTELPNYKDDLTQKWCAVFRCVAGGDFYYVGPLWSQTIHIQEIG